jgi:toxin ParE1/3/4
MKIAISPRARAELAAIFADSVEGWGLEQAQRYSDALIAAFDVIASRAIPWQAIPAEVEMNGYRRRSGRHIIYWRADADTVTIVAILHERMDQRARLRDDQAHPSST